jgi:Pyruvate/2-oxoacid:ferredoxin oxidoreductase delta subunit
MRKKEKGEEGHNSPVPFLRYKAVPGSEYEIECDMVISAIGQYPDWAGLEEVNRDQAFLKQDKNGMVQGLPGVFAGGDVFCLLLLTHAIGFGRTAAASIDRYVRGLEPAKILKPDIISIDHIKKDYFPRKPNQKREHVYRPDVSGNWEEILKPLTQERVDEEASRCMSCGLCFECDQCLIYCPQEAITRYKKNPVGHVMFTIYTRCVGCHICSEVCPTGFIDMGMGEDL